jgi:hypothetical protein
VRAIALVFAVMMMVGCTRQAARVTLVAGVTTTVVSLLPLGACYAAETGRISSMFHEMISCPAGGGLAAVGLGLLAHSGLAYLEATGDSPPSPSAPIAIAPAESDEEATARRLQQRLQAALGLAAKATDAAALGDCARVTDLAWRVQLLDAERYEQLLTDPAVARCVP